jgi:hypothetical protein
MVPQDRETGVSYREDFSGTEVVRQAETTIAMMAAQSKAIVEARFLVALRTGRNYEALRLRVGDLCKNPRFAETALYLKPMGKSSKGWAVLPQRDRLREELLKRERNRTPRPGDNFDLEQEWPMGFSIRFIESAIAEAGHIDVNATCIWEDEQKRITKVDVTDLMKNNAWSRTIITQKTVERKFLKKDQEYLAVRRNTFGDTVYVVEATESEVTQAEAAAVSKSVRTLAERIFPGHLKLEWRQICEATLLNAAAEDPEGKKKEILDSFHSIGVEPDNLSAYLEHGVEFLQPAEYLSLKVIYVSIRSGEVTWAQVMESKFGPQEGAEATKGAKTLKEKLERKISEQKKQESAAAAAPPAGQDTPQPSNAAPPAAPAPPAPESPAPAPAPQPAQPAAQGTPTQQLDAPDLFEDRPPAGQPAPARPVKTYQSGEELPDAFDMKVGSTAILIEGNVRKVVRVVEEPGEAPTWKTIESTPVEPAPQAVPQAVPPAEAKQTGKARGFDFRKGGGK